jgi:murein L,D-transpeptidase YcbB/YkuD
MAGPAVRQPAQAVRLIGDSVGHPPPGVLELRASISSRTLYVMRGDSLLAQYPVAVGTDEHPTPRGDFRIRKIVWNPRWVPPDAAWARGKSPKEPGSPSNPMQTVKIFFQEPDYYIHGTPAVESLGKAESHGCLRMDPDQAARVARLIMEHGGEPREENWFWRVLHFRREEKTVSLDNPIRMVVAD